MRFQICSFITAIVLFGQCYCCHAEEKWDIVIYGQTSAGIAAAVQATRMGKSVLVTGPDTHLGGLSSGGLGWTDSGNKNVIGGISREFYQRIKQHYDQRATWKWQAPEDYDRYEAASDAQWTFEPSIAERVFEELVRDYRINVDRDQWLNREPGKGVEKSNGRIAKINMLSGKSYRGKVFIDATYEGDLMAAAGVSYFVGREANSVYGETLNGVQIENATKHQFTNPIDPFVIPGDRSSGLLPKIQTDPPGKQGQGDHRIQAYNYRVCLTKHEPNRIPFPKPEGYDAKQYELLLRTLEAGSWHIAGKFDMLPNLKTDTNNHGSFSTDNIGMNYDYPEANYERRKQILDEHRTYQQGYFYFLANDPRVPEKQREWMSKWGLAKDEFTDNEHWPHQIYVREARRMVSDFVVTEMHVRRTKLTPRSVGMGSYNMDSHNTQRYVDENGHVRNEGDIQVSPGGPYPIDYGAIVPKQDECRNLFVPVCVSASHIAYGSIRMEPVFMILGQSAATAASLAIDEDQDIQDVSYPKLRELLIADHQVLETETGGIHSSKLNGVVIDDDKIEGLDGWVESNSIKSFVDRGYRHDNNQRKGELTASFPTKFEKSGVYELRISWSAHSNRATNVPVTVIQGQQSTRLTVNQQKKAEHDELFQSLGDFELRKNDKVEVQITNEGTDGFVVIDAVQWLRK